jgi:hypothetical protein
MTLCRRRLTHDHIQRDSPGKDKKANWLPALGGFMLALACTHRRRKLPMEPGSTGGQELRLIVGKASSIPIMRLY